MHRLTFICIIIVCMLIGCESKNRMETSGQQIQLLLDSAYQLERTMPDTALRIYKLVQQQAASEGNTIDEGRSIYYQGLVTYDQGDFDQASVYYSEALSLFEVVKDLENMSKVSNALGNLYNHTAQYTQAIHFFHKAIEYAQHIENETFEVIVLCNLGSVYQNTGRYDQSINILEQGIEIAKRINDTLQLANLYINLSTNYAQLDQLSKAVDYTIQAIDLYQKADSGPLECLATCNLVGFWMDVNYNDMEQLDQKMERIRYLLKQYPDPRNELTYYLSAAKYHIQNGEYDKSQELIDSAYLGYQKYPEKVTEHDLHFLEYLLYKRKEDFKNALASFELMSKVRDTLERNQNIRNMEELQVRYETSQKEQLIARQDLRIQKRTNQRNILYTLFVSIFFLLLFVINRSKSNKKFTRSKIALQKEQIYNLEQQQKLLAMDFMLQGQEEERKRIAQDLHDGLGGLLTSAQMQLRNVEKEIRRLHNMELFNQAESLIDNACREVRRIAHDMMPGTLEDLGLVASIEDLAGKVENQTDILVMSDLPSEEPVLSQIQMVNIYRIIQEVLSNTVKYAQANAIKISLQQWPDRTYLKISDNGKGFNQLDEGYVSGLGIKNIESRVKYLGGQIALTSNSNGTSYEIDIPNIPKSQVDS